MNKNIKSKIAIILVAAMLLPFASSCSLFGKKAVINAVTEFGDAIKTGDASGILHKTDDISREYKKSFKELLDLKNYTEEESAFATHMISTVEYTIDEKSIKINKDKATAGITLSIADLEELKKKDYKDITDLTSAVDSAVVDLLSARENVFLAEQKLSCNLSVAVATRDTASKLLKTAVFRKKKQ